MINKTQDEQALSFNNVTFSYDSTKQRLIQPLIRDLSFSIRAGEFVSIIGASGSGKSTIFRLIAGLEEQTTGTIEIAEEITENRLGKVGFMPQQDLLMPWRTIEENARLPLELKDKKFDAQLVARAIEEFGLSGYEKRYPGELSGGMRQRVSFLRATLTGADVLLLDEPFSALDAMTKLFMQEWLLGQWEKQKQTILFITHDIAEALFLSDRILVLTDHPISRLEEITVPLDRPRKQTDLNSREMINLKESLIEQFRAQVNQ